MNKRSLDVGIYEIHNPSTTNSTYSFANNFYILDLDHKHIIILQKINKFAMLISIIRSSRLVKTVFSHI